MTSSTSLFSLSIIILAVLRPPMSAQTPPRRTYPPPGKMIHAGGHLVHLNCAGQGHPAVMIVGAGYSFDWSLVQPEAAKFTRVCTYDPSGSVWSDPRPATTCDGRIEEIHSMLHNARETGPFILVGHSIGAVFARLYAARYPGEVEGMVISDHTGAYRITNGAAMMRSEEQTVGRLPPLARDMHHWAESRPGASDPRADRQLYDRCLDEAASTTKTRPDPLGNIPLLVIANGYLAGSEDYRNVQVGLLALSHNSKALIAPDSGHAIPLEDPNVLIQAIREVVTAARNHARLKPF